MNNGTDQREKKKVSGVFSLQEVKKVGTGTTTRKTIQKSFWYVTEMNDGSLEVQLLNSNYIPAGPKKTIAMEEFLGRYSPEPEFYVSNVFPKMCELNKTIARADRHRSNKELYSAEMEYNNALKLDIENVKANFGLGITYLERGEQGKAEDILSRVVKLDAAFEEEHKHLFNEFGINLRKNAMVKQSIKYYMRALELCTKDENLFYNIARAYLDAKEFDLCVEYLTQAVHMNPAHEVTAKFLLWLVQQKLVSKAMQGQVLEALKMIKEAKAGSSGQAIAAGEGQSADQSTDEPFADAH